MAFESIITTLANALDKNDKSFFAISGICVISVSAFFYTGMSFLSNEYFVRMDALVSMIACGCIGVIYYSMCFLFLSGAIYDGFDSLAPTAQLKAFAINSGVIAIFMVAMVTGLYYIINKYSDRHIMTFTCMVFTLFGLPLLVFITKLLFGKGRRE